MAYCYTFHILLTHRLPCTLLCKCQAVQDGIYRHTHLFNGPFSGTTRVSRHQKGKTNLDFTEARDSEWQWHQLGHMQVCTSLQTDNHASIPTLSFLQAGCRSCRPTNSVKALKAIALSHILDGSKSPSRKGALCRETPTLH